ncbi:hypothetical protein [Weissella paramesenteroides]|uniref:Uncharacterized protein n=1 Tax=Weissella paramesenteroides ATCC 33313 TaxID=585506 RepID=C5R8U0_WEIPA|nr:hypothetical protein [Weissella paramesenteroides]ATF40628.1 hypothetical protein CO680_00540 [Weissella paramesenteroides]EER75362.1 hypothetical protein HMPREF0877_0385 [Weissella paramesenteroides ATCC 33313]
MKGIYNFLDDFLPIFLITGYILIGLGLWELVEDVFTWSFSFNHANDILHCLFLGYILIKLAHKVVEENMSNTSDNDDDIKTYIAA